jgi:Tfp pilus assembly protein PilO
MSTNTKVEAPITLSQLTGRALLTTRRYLTVSGVVALSGVLLVVLGIIPQLNASLDLRSQVAKEEKVVTALERKARELEQLPTSNLFVQADQINRALPSQKPLLHLLTSLNAVGTQAGVIFEEINLSPGIISTDSAQPAARTSTRSKGAYQELMIDLKVRGSLAQINTFIEQAERMTPVSSLTSLTLQQLNTQTASAIGPQFDAELTVTTYYFTQPINATIEAVLPRISAEEEKVVAQIENFVSPQVAQQQTIVGGGLVDLFKLGGDASLLTPSTPGPLTNELGALATSSATLPAEPSLEETAVPPLN